MWRFLPLLVAAALPALAGDSGAAHAALLRAAGEALNTRPLSVMDKQKSPPSGDKHDYFSVAPYWWPDPAKPNGLPYIRRDGVTIDARDSSDYDRRALARMSSAVATLGLAYRETRDEKYSAHAARMLRTWFLEPATRMNPNLKFAQAIPGITEGRGTGVIDTAGLVGVVQACDWMTASPALTAGERQELRQWFATYLDWLLTSKHGRDEAAAQNNHGTWYDVQTAAFALFAGRKDLARRIAEEARTKRIAAQIEPGGSMPRELARTKSFSYSSMNLRAFCDLAELARQVDVDLWRFTTADGRSIGKAIEYLAPYVDSGHVWPHPQIEGGVTAAMRVDVALLLRRLGLALRDPRYEVMTRPAHGVAWEKHRGQILWPAP